MPIVVTLVIIFIVNKALCHSFLLLAGAVEGANTDFDGIVLPVAGLDTGFRGDVIPAFDIVFSGTVLPDVG